MAKPKFVSKNVKNLKITDRDQRILQVIAKTGMITKELATSSMKQQNLVYGRDRLDNLVKAGYLKAKMEIKGSKSEKIYNLDTKGKDYVKNNLSTVNHLYSYKSYEHDKEVCRQFLNLNSYQQDIALTESDLRGEFRHTDGSPPDIYVPEYKAITGETVTGHCIEVITTNYGEAEIRDKQDFANNNLNSTLTFVRV